jgi:REP element-mobilizing transposase RayT
MRPLRFIPEEGALVEVTCRTLHGRLLLCPSAELNELVIGILARACRLYPVRLVAFAFLSNHFHLLLEVDTAFQLARFMGYVNSNLAREAGRLADWREKFWSRRYQAILITQEERAQVERLKYLLAQGCKEGLVERPQDWPGAHAVRALLGEEELEGFWFDRTQEYAARRRGKAFERLQYATAEALTLAPLPAWRHLPPDVYRERVAELVEEIVAAAAGERESSGRTFLGPHGVRGQHPHDRPVKMKKSPAPFCHAATRWARKALREAYFEFFREFQDAADRWKGGDRGACFPIGSFPPGLPFVGG